MYLTEPKPFDVVKKQFRFKMNANAASFTTLIFLQIMAIAIGVLGMSSSPEFEEFPRVELQIYSSDGSVGITLFWAIILGAILTSKAHRNEPFTFVTNRLSLHFSNFLFMLAASVIGGITAVLTGSIIKLFVFLRHGEAVIQTPGLLASPTDFFVRIITLIAYLLLLFLVGYAIGSFFQHKKLFILLFFIGWILFSSVFGSWNGPHYVESIMMFFGNEQYLSIFLIKISGTILVLFAISAAITNRLEVRN